MSSKLFKIKIIQPAFDTLLQKYGDSFSSTNSPDREETHINEMNKGELDKLNKLSEEIDILKNSNRLSAEHIKWIAGTKKFLLRNFGKSSDYYNTFTSLTWAKRGQYMIGGPARPSESFNPQLGIDRVNREAYLKELEVTRGLFLAAKEDIIEKDFTPQKPGDSVKIFSVELINKLPDDVKDVCEEFNFNFNERNPWASLLLLRKLLPLSIVRRMQQLKKEREIKVGGEYLDTKGLLGKIEKYLKEKRVYKEVSNYKILTDSSQHSYTFYPGITDVEGAAVKIRLLLDDMFS